MKSALLPLAAALALLPGCAAQVDKASVRATAAAPSAAQVEVLEIPYDPALPTYVVTVAPLAVGADSGGGAVQTPTRVPRYGWGPWGWGPWGGAAPSPAPGAYVAQPNGLSERVGVGIAAQLTSALANAGNVAVLDYEHWRAHENDLRTLRRPGEAGPFVIKGTVTEFNETAEADETRQGGSLGWAGGVLGVVGALSGVPGAALAGAAVSAANPSFEKTRARRAGSVGLDLQLIEPSSGRMVGVVVSHGSFSSESAVSGFSLFGVGGGESAFAASALGQATRAALNDAVRKLTEQLRAKGASFSPKSPSPPARRRR